MSTIEEITRQIQEVRLRVSNSKPVLMAIAQLMVNSAKQNFPAEGRPDKWTPLSKAYKIWKDKHGYTKILSITGQLSAHIVPDATDTQAIAGDNLAYAQIQSEGGTINMKARTQTVRHRTNAKGELIHQSNIGMGPHYRNSNMMLVFAKKSHKRVLERAFSVGAYQVVIPARPFLLFQPGEVDLYVGIVENYWFKGVIKR